jgi:biopolymer transport protein ExbD
MAFNLSNGGGSGSGFNKSRFRGTSALSEINVVPFVDVLLVLLVIFMLTAHVMEYGLEVQVPEVSQQRTTVEQLPVVTVSKLGDTYLNDKPVKLALIVTELHRQFPKAKDVYVRADAGLTWQVLAQVISELGTSKINVKLVTRPTDAANRKR